MKEGVSSFFDVTLNTNHPSFGYSPTENLFMYIVFVKVLDKISNMI